MSQISRKKMRCTYFFYFERRKKHPHCFDVWEAVGMKRNNYRVIQINQNEFLYRSELVLIQFLAVPKQVTNRAGYGIPKGLSIHQIIYALCSVGAMYQSLPKELQLTQIKLCCNHVSCISCMNA